MSSKNNSQGKKNKKEKKEKEQYKTMENRKDEKEIKNNDECVETLNTFDIKPETSENKVDENEDKTTEVDIKHKQEIEEIIRNCMSKEFNNYSEKFSNNMQKNIKDILEKQIVYKDIKNDIDTIKNSIINNNIQKYINNDIKSLDLKLDKVNKEHRKICLQIQDINDATNHMQSKIQSLEIDTNTIQTLEGKINSISDLKETIEKIYKKINKEERISNLEEEVIKDLGKYGEKIVKELTNAARCYAQNKDIIQSIRDERIEYEKKISHIQKQSKYDGIETGKVDTMKEIVDKCDGIDELFDSEDPFKKVICDMLKNNGFSRDEELKINKEIIITEENVENIGEKASDIHIGKYIVTKSAILLNSEIYKYAVLDRIDND